MQAAEVMALLRDHASADARALLGPRYGSPVDNALGVSMADMKRLARPLGRDHALAADLWATGVYEARVVAGLVDDPAAVTVEQLDSWCADFDSWAICDTVCFTLFDRAPDAWTRLQPWAADDALFVRRASFALLWSLALHDTAAPDDRFLAALDLVEECAARRAPARRQVDLDGAARGGPTEPGPAGSRARDGDAARRLRQPPRPACGSDRSARVRGERCSADVNVDTVGP